MKREYKSEVGVKRALTHLGKRISRAERKAKVIARMRSVILNSVEEGLVTEKEVAGILRMVDHWLEVERMALSHYYEKQRMLEEKLREFQRGGQVPTSSAH